MTSTIQLNTEDRAAVAKAMEYRSTSPLPNSVMMALVLQWHDSQIITCLKEGKIDDTSLLRKHHKPAWAALQQLANGEAVVFADPEIVDPDVGCAAEFDYCSRVETFLDELRAYRERPNTRTRRLVDAAIEVDQFIWININTDSDSHATYDFCMRAETASHVWAEESKRPGVIDAAGLAYFALKLPAATLDRLVEFVEGRDPDSWCKECEIAFDTEGCCGCTIFIGDEDPENQFIPRDES